MKSMTNSNSNSNSKSMGENMNKLKRGALKKIALVSSVITVGEVMPKQWVKPIITSIVLPAHAQTTVVTNPLCSFEGPTSLFFVNGGGVTFPLVYTVTNIGDVPLTSLSISFSSIDGTNITVDPVSSAPIPVGGSRAVLITAINIGRCALSGTGSFTFGPLFNETQCQLTVNLSCSNLG